ncbi:hypothetical protein MTP99_007878 [Tenebrio molitor]|nr:hypothetical protein MTP99_007878 [Tenebrio molitor]
MVKALRANKKPLPPIHGTRGLVFSDDEKAEAFADSLELQCRPKIADANLDQSRKSKKSSRNRTTPPLHPPHRKRSAKLSDH